MKWCSKFLKFMRNLSNHSVECSSDFMETSVGISNHRHPSCKTYFTLLICIILTSLIWYILYANLHIHTQTYMHTYIHTYIDLHAYMHLHACYMSNAKVQLLIYNSIMGGSQGDVSEEHVTQEKRAYSATFTSLHLHHSSFSNTFVALPTSQLILQPFRRFTYVTAHSPTLPLLHLRHS